MSTTLQTDQVVDLASIVANLDHTIAGYDTGIAEQTAHVDELRLELASIQRNKANYASDLAQTTANVTRLQAEVTRSKKDLTLARGTSVEAQKHEELAAVQEGLRRAEAQLSTLQASHNADSKAEQDTATAIAETQQKIEALVASRQETQETRTRFSREHCEHVKQLALEALGECDAELSRLLAQVEQAKEYRTKVLRKLAVDLATWPRIAEQILLEHGTFEDPPEAQMLAAKLTMIEALEANWQKLSLQVARLAVKDIPVGDILKYGGYHELRGQIERARAQNGSVHIANPVIQAYEMHVIGLIGQLEGLRQQYKQRQAHELLNTSLV